jgi:cell division topological specificity factor
MIDVLKWALHKQERTKESATKRLKLILVLDRIGLAQNQLEAMKKDIVEVVSRYLVVDEESVEMDMRRSDEALMLVSNMAIKEVIRAFASPEPGCPALLEYQNLN